MGVIQRHHVAAGTFLVSDANPVLLQAYLGTCVGLSLYCKKTGIGGMIHLLLPDPISLSSANQPEKYASTGVPLVIDALLEKGAHKEAIVACLAGGALVDPLSEQDLILDIGGRTAETARAILNEYGIKIARSETGGFFTCCLTLDMATGKSTIEPAGQHKVLPNEKIDPPGPDEIKTAMDRLQPIPQVALKVMRLINEGGHMIDKVASEIRKDQVISARTLSLANSAMFAKRHPIETLDHALVFLGQDMLIKLVLTAAVQSYFEQSGSGYSLCKGGLYHHAVGCAQVAEALAQKTGKMDANIAYTAGLLHDIGKVVLDQYIAPAYPLFYRQAMESNENILEVENRLMGITHTEVGQILAKQWSFPDSLKHVVRYHHYPEQSDEHHILSVIVYTADLLLSRFHIGFEIERIDTGTLNEHLGSIDLTVDDFACLVDLIPNSVFNSITETVTLENNLEKIR